MRKIVLPPITEEERESIIKSMLAELVNHLYGALEEALGPSGALKQLRPYLRNGGYAFTSNMRRMFNIEGDNIQAIGMINELASLFSSIDAQTIEFRDRKIVRICTNCIWKNNPVGLCRAGHESGRYVVEAVNPDYEYKIIQMIPNGDPVCSLVIERK